MVKKKGHAKKHRRIRNLLEKYKYRGPTPNKIKEETKIFDPLYVIHILEYRKEKDFWKEEDYIKMFLKALKEDIGLYKGLKEKYGASCGKQVIQQTNRHSSGLLKKLSSSDLAAERKQEYERQYGLIKAELKCLGFYDN